MIRWLTALLGDAVERSLRTVLSGVVAVTMAALFTAVSLGFGTFAAYGYLRGVEGAIGAALILCSTYGLVAVAILVLWAVRHRHVRRVRRAASAPAPAATVTSVLQALAAAGTPQDREVMAAAIRLGRELSPMHLLALAIIGGFIVGRKLDK
jgi:uncharacterized membrane protein